MCGIGGIRRFGEAPILEANIRGLMLGLEHRGNDASGIAIANKAGVHVLKSAKNAWAFVLTKEYEDFIEEQLTSEAWIAMVHTRAATKGSPLKNENNHPMWAGNTAVIHNGMISNDDFLFGDLKLTRSAETDSDILRAILDAGGLTPKGARKLSRVSGSVACAAISSEYPGRLLLARSGSPLVLANVNDLLIFASEKSLIHKAMRNWSDFLKLPFQRNRLDISFLTMADNQLYIFGEKADGVIFRDEFKTAYVYNQPNYARVFDDYEVRQKRFKANEVADKARKEEERVTGEHLFAYSKEICPNLKCKAELAFEAESIGTPLEGWFCKSCGANLKTGIIEEKYKRKEKK